MSTDARAHDPIIPVPEPVSSDRRARLFGLAILAAALAASTTIVVTRALDLGTVPIDGAYYLAKAIAFGETGELSVPWGNGLDTKFFPGLSLLFALPLRALGMPWGWIVVEAAALIAVTILISLLGRRLSLGPVGCNLAGAAFALDPLVLKWASVPYAEIPALALILGAVALAANAIDSRRRAALELAAALLLGCAGAMRLEALIALPLLVLFSNVRRAFLPSVAASLALGVLAMLPLGLHLWAMQGHGTPPAQLKYVSEFYRNFSGAKYLDNALGFASDLIRWSPPKPEVLKEMGDALATAYVGARVVATALALAGLASFLGRKRRVAAALPLALLLAYPLIHAAWHYSDARFLLLVWPVLALCVGRGAELFFEKLPPIFAAGLAVLLVLVAAIFGATGYRTALAHARSWERATGGPADEFMRRLSQMFPPEAEGIYEFGGPMFAMYRKERARFGYGLANFFDPDALPDAIPKLLEEGPRFLVTSSKFPQWLDTHVTDPGRRAKYKAVIADSRRLVIVVAK